MEKENKINEIIKNDINKENAKNNKEEESLEYNGKKPFQILFENFYANMNKTEKKLIQKKYRINYSKIISKLRTESDKIIKKAIVEFESYTLLLNSSVDITNKISLYTLITFLNHSKKNKEYIYYLNNKIYKYLDKNKGTEPFIYIRTLWRASCLLGEENNNFYAYYYLNKALKMVKFAKMSDDSRRLLDTQWKNTLNEIKTYLTESYENFQKGEMSNDKGILKVKTIIDNILSLQNEIKTDICYLISCKWLLTAKVFIECLIKQKEEDLSQFLNDSFKSDVILKEYLEEPNQRKANGQFFPGPIDNYCITDFKDSLIDPLKEEENSFLKKDLKINTDYFIISDEDWISLKNIFGYTNIFKRNKHNIDLQNIKVFLYDKRFKYNYCEFMIKKRRVQIPEMEDIKSLEDKIIRSVDNELKNELQRIKTINELKNMPRKIKRKKRFIDNKDNKKESNKKVINILDDEDDEKEDDNNSNNITSTNDSSSNNNDKNDDQKENKTGKKFNALQLNLSKISNEELINCMNKDTSIECLKIIKSKVNQKKIKTINITDKFIDNKKNKSIDNEEEYLDTEHYEYVDIIKEMEEVTGPLNKEEKTILFYWIPKSKKDILIEINYGFLNGMSKFEYEYLYPLVPINNGNINDLKVKDLINFIGKDKILIAEIVPKNKIDDYKFLYPLYPYNISNNSIDMKYQCPICNKPIDSMKNSNSYQCDKCHFSKFCSATCSSESENHIILDECLSNLLVSVFDLNEFLKKDLYDCIPSNLQCRKGITGLYNIGNSCYMNASLQCLSNTPDLTKYFLLDIPSSETNTGNRLGSNGELCKSYSRLITNLWLGDSEAIDPTFIKTEVFRVSKQFGDYEQQDSQEFLSVFLDHLHEDVNHITTKPYIELTEQLPGEDDLTASKRWWDSHKKREDSIIVDLFHGQFKNTITCAKCGNQNITYDPFMFLGLPIPSTHNQIIVKYFEDDQMKTINFPFEEKSSISNLKEKVLESVILKSIKLELKDLSIEERQRLSSSITAIELDKDKKIIDTNPKQELKIISLLKRNLEICFYKKKGGRDYFNIYIYPILIKNGGSAVYLSYPIAITVTKTTTLEELNKLTVNRLNNFFNKKAAPKKDEPLLEIQILHNISKPSGFAGFFSSKPTCEFCRQSCDPDTFCPLYSKKLKPKSTVQDVYKILSSDRPLILLVKSQFFDYNKQIYDSMNLGLDNFINSDMSNKKGNYNLFDALHLFGQKEILDKENMWFCKRCKEHREASKIIQIYKAPNYLIVQLKRFKLKSGNVLISFLQSGKIDTYIEYPIVNFDLSSYVMGPGNEKAIYNLYAVVEHHGFLDGGHYTAVCKNNNMWVRYNDAHVERAETPLNKNAYLLFYKRANLGNNNTSNNNNDNKNN